MIPNDEYQQAVRERTPELAFVYLEQKFRDKLNDNLQDVSSSDGYDDRVREYMNHTMATARALGVHIVDSWDVLSHKQRNLSDQFKDFTAAIDYFKVQIQIDNARSTLRFSVGLDSDEKEKLRNYVAEIKK